MKLSTIIFIAFLFLFLSTEINAQIDSSETHIDTTKKVKIRPAILLQGIPNPFKDNAKIEYQIPLNSKSARFEFKDINQKLIKTVKIDHKGNGSFDFDAKGLKTGVYAYTLFIDNVAQETKKMIVEYPISPNLKSQFPARYVVTDINGKQIKTIVIKRGIFYPRSVPNPFSGSVEFQIPLNSKSARLVLTDINGKQIKTITIDNKGFIGFNYGSIALETGVYSCTLLIDNVAVQQTRKFVIE